MSVVPKSAKDFSDPEYWKKFFEKRKTAFEWYGDYFQLGPLFENYIKSSDLILQIGCGNSHLSDQLYDNGFRNVISIDTDSKVIKQQINNNLNKRPELKFMCKSATENGMPDASVNIVIDKGTTDALLPTNFNSDHSNLVRNIFLEVERCLVPLGRFMIVTLAQQHVIEFIINHFFFSKKFLIRVQKCEFTDKSFTMPVFVIIITKLNKEMSKLMNIEFIRQTKAKIVKTSDFNELMSLIESEQELNWFKHYASKNIVSEAAIKICGLDGRPRYQLTIVDDDKVKSLKTVSAFIVPLGREADWLFSTAKGRKILRKECGENRVIIIGLFREQIYESLECIQKELNDLIISLKPIDCRNNKINYLSLGEFDAKKTIANGKSNINGEWSVEETIKSEKCYRRLIFLNCLGLIQSEVEILEKKKKSVKFQNDFLACEHHRSMLTALNFLYLKKDIKIDCITQLLELQKIPLRFSVLGLGGGLFPKFLYNKFSKATIVAVEIDSDILTIAQKYFELPDLNERFNVVINDAKIFLEEYSLKTENDKFDALFIDLAGPVNEDGLSCPPPQFVTDYLFKKMKSCLKKNGVLAFNLVTRDEKVSTNIKEKIKLNFPFVYNITSDENVNEVLICSLNKGKPLTANTKLKEEWLIHHIEEINKLSLIT